MNKIISQDQNSYSYMVTIKSSPYVIKVSKNGDLIGVNPYMESDDLKEVSNRKYNIEFG